MRVELLFWAGCPSHEKALQELREVLAEEGLDPQDVDVREVETDGDAAAERFVGSPTVRVDGVDVQREPNEPVGLTCRVYTRRDGRISPTPDPEDIRDLVRCARTRASARAAAGDGDSRAAAGDGDSLAADGDGDSLAADGDTAAAHPDSEAADGDPAAASTDPAAAARGAR